MAKVNLSNLKAWGQLKASNVLNYADTKLFKGKGGKFGDWARRTAENLERSGVHIRNKNNGTIYQGMETPLIKGPVQEGAASESSSTYRYQSKKAAERANAKAKNSKDGIEIDPNDIEDETISNDYKAKNGSFGYGFKADEKINGEAIENIAEEIGRQNLKGDYDAVAKKYFGHLEKGDVKSANSVLNAEERSIKTFDSILYGGIGATVGGVGGAIIDAADDGEVNGGGVALGMLAGAGIGGFAGYKHGTNRARKGISAFLLENALRDIGSEYAEGNWKFVKGSDGKLRANSIESFGIFNNPESKQGSQIGAVVKTGGAKTLNKATRMNLGYEDEYLGDVIQLSQDIMKGEYGDYEDLIAKSISNRYATDQGPITAKS